MARARPSFLVLALSAAVLLLGAGATGAAAAAKQPTPPPPPLAPVAADSGLAFSGSGFLGVFHLGVLQALQDLGLATSATRVAGTSGGSLMSGISCLGVSQKDAWDVAQKINHDCRGEWSCAGQLDRAVKAAMRQAVSMAMASAGYRRDAGQAERDAFVVGRCGGGGRARFTVSVVDAAQRPAVALKAAKPWFVADFKSEDDFVNAGAASSYIPLFSGKEAGALGRGGGVANAVNAAANAVVWHTSFRNVPAVDGGFSAGLPPCVPGVKACVSISAVTKDPGAPAMPGMGPPSTGAADLEPPADISPGLFSPLPAGLNRKTWQMHALVAPMDKMAADMQKHGYEQAVLWACKKYADLMAAAGKCEAAAAKAPRRMMAAARG